MFLAKLFRIRFLILIAAFVLFQLVFLTGGDSLAQNVEITIQAGGAEITIQGGAGDGCQKNSIEDVICPMINGGGLGGAGGFLGTIMGLAGNPGGVFFSTDGPLFSALGLGNVAGSIGAQFQGLVEGFPVLLQSFAAGVVSSALVDDNLPNINALIGALAVIGDIYETSFTLTPCSDFGSEAAYQQYAQNAFVAELGQLTVDEIVNQDFDALTIATGVVAGLCG